MHSEATPPRAAFAGSLGAAALLGALAFVLYLGAGSFGFVNYDDPLYVSANPVVARGLTADGLAWAFSFQAANWHPLTWLSHMLDVELFGLEPGPMHLVNVGLHALNTALLFLALARLTRRPWPSGFVAALFAVHPLRVQCVAWIAERKELLAGAFFFALLLAHERHARTRSRGAYVALLACMALGCMAKPMLVTAPFVLLLLDAWPLGRFGAPAASSAPRGSPWLEKLPLFALAAVTSVLTWKAQSAGHAIGALGALPLVERVLAAGMGLLAYLRACFWPVGLAAFYPHPLLAGRDLWLPGLAGIALALGLTLLAWRARRSHPPLFTGWCWFLGMLVPVLGLVQVGDQGWADRYTYLPTIGLALALVFELVARARIAAPVLAGAGLAACGLFAVATLRTLPHWRDSRSLFERALAVTEGNWVAHNNLGLVYLERRELDRAEEHFEAALEARPSFPEARFNLGRTLEGRGDFAAATRAYLAFLEDHPGHVETLLALAILARADGDAARAQGYLERATEAAPDDPRAWVALARAFSDARELERAANCAASALRVDPTEPAANLVLADVALKRDELPEALRRIEIALAHGGARAEALALQGRARVLAQDLAGARESFEAAVALEPTSASARYDYGTLLLRLGEREAAAGQFAAVRDLRPGDGQVLVALGVMALEDGRAAEALELLEQAQERMPSSPIVLTNLAAAHERLGHWSQALEAYQRSFEVAPPLPDAARAAAWILATGPDEALLDGARAVELASYAAVRQAPNALEVLAAAHARAGDFAEAEARQQEAIQQARGPSQRRALEERLALYRSGQAFTRPR